MEISPLKRERDSATSVTQRVYTTLDGRRVRAYVTTAEAVEIMDLALVPDVIVLPAVVTSADGGEDDNDIEISIKYDWKETLKELTGNDCTFNNKTKKWNVSRGTLARLGISDGGQLEKLVKQRFLSSSGGALLSNDVAASSSVSTAARPTDESR